MHCRINGLFAGGGLRMGIAAGVCLLWGASDGATRSWSNGSGGTFSNALNWSGLLVPGASDSALFDLSSGYTVTFSTSPVNQRLLIGDDIVTLDLNGHTYSLTSSGSASLVVGTTTRGLTAAARLTIADGTVSGVAGLVGDSGLIGSGGTLLVNSGGILQLQTLYIGAGRPGTLTIQGGGDGTASFAAVVGDQSAGHATVTGSGSTWMLGSSLDIGSQATGQLDVAAGGVVSGAGPATVGYPSGIGGVANISGNAKWAMRDLVLGGLGSGTLNISGGGSVDVTGTGSYVASIGDQFGGSGIVALDGTGSRFRAAGQLKVGNFGSGQLQVTNGAVAVSGLSFIGYSGLGAGTVSLGGASTVWGTGGLYVGGGTSSAGGSGVLTIGPGTTLQNSNTGTLKIWSTGTVNLNGGTIQTGSLQVAAGGHLNWTSGIVWITNAPISVGPGGMLGNTLSIGSGQQLWGGDMRIGDGGAGTVSLSGGGTISMFHAFVGYNAPGRLDVMGPGSDWTSYLLTVGQAASGTVNITGGAHFLSSSSFSDPLVIGDQAAITGSVLVDGPGTVWDNSADPASPGYLFVGRSGTGNLTVSNSASFVNAATHGTIASEPGSQGAITLSSGGQMSLQYDLLIGEYGQGALGIDSGADLTGESAEIAHQAGSVSGASVDGTGSTWTMSGSFVVADAGSGSLSISNGGSVSASESYIALGQGSAGSVTVSGSGSSWTNNGSFGYLIVGGASDGSLNVLNGAAVSAKETFIGDGSIGVGTVVVNGTGSTFTNASELSIGYFGNGTMVVSGGAVVTNADGFIAAQTGSTGYALVQGAGSTWNNTNGLDVGFSGAGVLTVDAGGAIHVGNTLKVWSGGLVNYNGGTLSTGTLDLAGGGRMVLSPGGNKVVRVNNLLIDAAGGSQLDLADNDLIVDYTGASPLAAIRDLIKSARGAGSAWTGGGITSSLADASTFALGYADNTTLGLSVFSAESIDATSVLVKYTYYGDTNLDGQVDVVDLGALATAWQTSGSWVNGDLNYDGSIDVVDLGLLATNWQAGVGNPLGPGSFSEALTAYGLPNVAVPEPIGMGLIALGFLLRRRRRVAWPVHTRASRALRLCSSSRSSRGSS